jgi:hypothetical protein
MSKDLTSRMHMKMKLYTHKLQEGGSASTHLSVFKEIIADLQSMEVKYEDGDLGLILLCSMPSSFANFRDTILYSRDTLTVNKVYEALQAKQKMKQMVSSAGSASNGEALSVRDRTQNKSNDAYRGKSSNDYRGRSKSRGEGEKFCRYCKKVTHFISECYKLKNKEKRAGTYRPKGNSDEGNTSVSSTLIVQIILRFLLLLLDVQILVMNGFLILLLPFIYALIEIGSSLMILSKVVLLKWLMIVHIILLALDLFRLRCMMVLSKL